MLLTAVLAVLLAGCGNPDRGIPNPQKSVYFWKTVYDPDSLETAFVTSHQIKKLYIRYFDVILDKDQQLQPNATIRFRKRPEGFQELVPTVFIVEKCLYHNLDTLAHTIVDRIIQISKTNHVDNVGEIQIDCDWTRKSQDKYFVFLGKVRDYCKSLDLRLSATIRLHQLGMAPPPCDYGVLMLYNTGNVHNNRVENPILGYPQVKPYLRYLKDYPLPMCAALPNFKWQMLNSNGEFRKILYNLDMDDSTMFAPIDSATYLVTLTRLIPLYMGDQSFNVRLLRGDTIRIRKAEYSEISRVVSDIQDIRPALLSQVIIYDLNSYNINNLNKLQYEEIFNTCGSPAVD